MRAGVDNDLICQVSPQKIWITMNWSWLVRVVPGHCASQTSNPQHSIKYRPKSMETETDTLTPEEMIQQSPSYPLGHTKILLPNNSVWDLQ